MVKSAHVKAGSLVFLVVISIFVLFNRISVSTDLSLFLPEPETRFDELLRHQLDNGASSNIVLISFSGLPTEQLAQFSKAFSAKLRSSDTFGKVSNSAVALSDEALVFLEKNRYLLTHSDLQEKFSVEGFSQSLALRLEGLSSTSAPIEKKFLRQDPTGEVMGLLNEWQGKISRHKRPNEKHGVWFSDDFQRTLVLAEIGSDVTEMANQEVAVDQIRRTYNDLKLPGLDVVMAGPSVFAVESSEDIKEDVRILTIIAVTFVVLFLLFVYRSVRMMLLVVCPLAVGVIVATAVILLAHGQIHGITLAFGITLAGVAVDYPIHLLSGMGKEVSNNQAHVKNIWRTLRLGVFSTVIAYAAFLTSGFSGLQQLGLFTIVGLIVAALFSRWVLPFLAVSGTHAMPGLTRLHELLQFVAKKAPACQYLVPAILIVSFLALTFSERNILHLNVDSLSPINEDRRAEGKMLRNDLGFWYGGSMMLVTADTKEGVLQYSEYLQSYLDVLQKDKVIEGYDMAAHFLPSVKKQKQNQLELQDQETILENLQQAMSNTPFKAKVFDPFIEQLEESKNLSPIHFENLEKSFIGKKLSPLIFDFNSESAGVILLHGVSDDVKMKAFSDQHDRLYYMHLKSASTDLVARSVDRVAISILGCIGIIYIALAMAFRCCFRPFRILIPTLAAAIATAALLVFSGNPLSIFHLISLLLVVGLGLDYALFFNRLPENNDEWGSTFKSLWICATTTILVFGILTYSNTPPLKAIGITVGIGAFLSMIFAAMWSAIAEKNSKNQLKT